MQEKEELYWYWLCNLSGIGNKRIKRLLDVFKSPKAVFYAAPEALHGCTGLTQPNIETIMKNRNMEKVYKSFTQLQHKGISFIYKEGKQYPQNLLQLYDMPYGLYSKGQPLCADEPAVAMVGARGCSGYGRSVAYSFAKAFAQLGITVVSGMASGIDTAAHDVVLRAGEERWRYLETAWISAIRVKISGFICRFRRREQFFRNIRRGQYRQQVDFRLETALSAGYQMR